MFTRSFWTQTVERAVKTAAQAAAALIALHLAAPSLLAVPWSAIGAAAALAALGSVATSLASAAVGPADSPSVVQTEPDRTYEDIAAAYAQRYGAHALREDDEPQHRQ